VNGVDRARNGCREIPLRAKRHLYGVLILNKDGAPVGLRVRCKDPECCSRQDGFVSFHTFSLVDGFNEREVGEYTKGEREPHRAFGDLVKALHRT
jgi:hypothetical protein